VTSAEIHHRRMARYRARPTTTCASCGRTIRLGTRRTTIDVDVPVRGGRLAFHPRCADKGIMITPALRRAATRLAVHEAALELIAAIDALPAKERERAWRVRSAARWFRDVSTRPTAGRK
jgi:hypothetical protein